VQGQEQNERVHELEMELERFKSTVQSMVNEKVTELTAELHVEMEEKVRVYKETEYSLQKQLNHIKDQFTSLKSNQEYAQATTSNTDLFGTKC
jgi:homeobox protein cut-like